MLPTRAMLSLIVLPIIVTGCTKKADQPVDLRSRIIAARSKEYCNPPKACFSPHILVMEKRYFVTVFSGDRPQNTAVSAEALGKYLTALPMSAWPSGPVVGITPTDDVMDWHAIQKNLEQAQRICRSLGLDVQLHPGG